MNIPNNVEVVIDSAGVPVRISVNAFNVGPAGTMPCHVSMLGLSGGLAARQAYVSIVLFGLLLHWSPCLSNVDSVTFAAGNLVNHTVSPTGRDWVLWEY